jgi:hypothetical protein
VLLGHACERSALADEPPRTEWVPGKEREPLDLADLEDVVGSTVGEVVLVLDRDNVRAATDRP